MREKKDNKIKVVKDKEGVVFIVALDPVITKKDRKRRSVKYVKSFIEKELRANNVFPQNNQVGFRGDIDTVSYFIASLIETYTNQCLIDEDFNIN